MSRTQDRVNNKARQLDPHAFMAPLTKPLVARRIAARVAAWGLVRHGDVKAVYEWRKPELAMPAIYFLDQYPPPKTTEERALQIAGKRVTGLDYDQIANEFEMDVQSVRAICRRYLRPVRLVPQDDPVPPSLPWRLRNALKAAAARDHGNICPITRTSADGEAEIVSRLEELGLAAKENGRPIITEAGREAIQ